MNDELPGSHNGYTIRSGLKISEETNQEFYNYAQKRGAVSRIIERYGDTPEGRILALREILTFYTGFDKSAVDPIISEYEHHENPLLSYARRGRPEFQSLVQRAILEFFQNQESH